MLLIGEPLGMLGTLFAVWGREVKRDLRWIRAHRSGRAVAGGVSVLLLAGAALATTRVARATGITPLVPGAAPGLPLRLDLDAPAVSLFDQFGGRTSLADFRGQTVLLTFAFGHCSTVCPRVVNDLRVARREANRPDVRLVVITLDPWRDAPDRLATIAGHWGLAPKDRVLSGSVAEVERALDSLGIGRRRNERTGDIEHTATVLILNERGRIAWRVEGGWGGLTAVARLLLHAR